MDTKEVFYPMTGKIVLTMPDANGIMIQCRIPQPLADGQPSHNDLDDNGCCYFGRYSNGRWHWEHRRPVNHPQQAATHYLPADVYALPVRSIPPQD